MPMPQLDPRRAIRRLNIVGYSLILVLVGGVGGWAATSRLSGAVIAPGKVVVESSVKKVQHPTGGVVGAILVKEGETVREGEVVMRLDDTVTKATLGMAQSQLDQLMAREARLVAERDSTATITFPPELIARQGEQSVNASLKDEVKLFESRAVARTGQRAQLRERVTQTQEEIRGLAAQQTAKEGEIKLITEELVGVTELYGKNLVSISRLMTLRRDKARLEGERGQYIAEIARARGKISETEMQIIQLDRDFRSELLNDLRETQGKIAEFKERRTAAKDQLKRVDIRAPQSGVVLDLSVHTVGGVISPGETIMEIVPRADALVIDARVTPQDIDQVAVGAKAIVHILAGDQRTIPDVSGVLTRISADVTKEPQSDGRSAPASYLVRIALPAEKLQELKSLRLVPGMSAEAFIQTYARTPLEYLLKPLREQIARTFRER